MSPAKAKSSQRHTLVTLHILSSLGILCVNSMPFTRLNRMAYTSVAFCNGVYICDLRDSN
jgi:hypothetical protein